MPCPGPRSGRGAPSGYPHREAMPGSPRRCRTAVRLAGSAAPDGHGGRARGRGGDRTADLPGWPGSTPVPWRRSARGPDHDDARARRCCRAARSVGRGAPPTATLGRRALGAAAPARRPAAEACGAKRSQRPALRCLCRDGGIRTHDPLTPSQVRYQAAPRPAPALPGCQPSALPGARHDAGGPEPRSATGYPETRTPRGPGARGSVGSQGRACPR